MAPPGQLRIAVRTCSAAAHGGTMQATPARRAAPITTPASATRLTVLGSRVRLDRCGTEQGAAMLTDCFPMRRAGFAIRHSRGAPGFLRRNGITEGYMRASIRRTLIALTIA